ncbi:MULTISPECIES: RNA 2',3'-cyclic phosphodiesterase [unclassified Halanaerobium]|uniref:RNA 2',3'-cyclic phosphodiesterase n=1 Tax=unclassified Halanaerobium TaxID=2641197 RepID=UPI000E19D41F|nr:MULTISPECIES: RNA 2',3'-cyclic phosphodiesterase [unclassified Halanaerobium]RCW51514.1 2'-5' RNA ligase [Halanaerobium sp. MA284_MarDTE_T2]RCW89302.1 2'-5' RNA ligase [Halanaerobium sp. DL-01]
MRLFIAVDLTERARELIFKKVTKLKKEINENIKWVEKENFHLTVKFLGENDKNKTDAVIKQLQKLDFSCQHNYIQFKKLGAFPELGTFKVLFVSVFQGKNSLIRLNNSIENSMQKIGFKKEKRKFIPHLTLARKKNNRQIKKLTDKNSKFLDENYINVFSKLNTVTLYESILKPSGPEYKKIFSKKLQ